MGRSGVITSLIITLFLAYIGLQLVAEFHTPLEGLTDFGGGIGDTIGGLVVTWLIPLALIGLVIYVVRKFLGRGR